MLTVLFVLSLCVESLNEMVCLLTEVSKVGLIVYIDHLFQFQLVLLTNFLS